MPGLVPGIHEFPKNQKMDGRDKPGHDGDRGWRYVAADTPVPIWQDTPVPPNPQ